MLREAEIKKIWIQDAPEGQAWHCPDCLSSATLGGNAGYHATKTGHGIPTLGSSPRTDIPGHYEQSRSADWTSYDRVATALADMKFLLLEMGDDHHKQQLRNLLGPENYKRLNEFFVCAEGNLQKMGRLATGWAATAMDRALEGRDGGASEADAKQLDKMEQLRERHEINRAWNIAEEWSKR